MPAVRPPLIAAGGGCAAVSVRTMAVTCWSCRTTGAGLLTLAVTTAAVMLPLTDAGAGWALVTATTAGMTVWSCRTTGAGSLVVTARAEPRMTLALPDV